MAVTFTIMLIVKSRKHWPFIVLLVIVILAWRWLWGFCWSPLATECSEGIPEGSGWFDHIWHFYGWLAYAMGNPVSLVPPMFSNWSWPTTTPLIYTDSIPLAAIIFRPLYQAFLVKFQYFSLLSLVNMVISALCGYILGCRVVGSRSSGCLLGILLAIAPPSIIRINIAHEALSLHCLLIIPITLLILRNSTLWAWALLLFVAMGVNAYFMPMLLIFTVVRIVSKDMRPTAAFSRWIYRLLPQHHNQRARSANLLARLLDAACLFLTCLLGAFVFGYISPVDMLVKVDMNKEMMLHSANILTFFDSRGLSAVFSKLDGFDFQGDGFSYLGVLITVLVSLSLYRVLINTSRPGVSSVATLFPSPQIYWSLVVLTFIYSLGLDIYLGELKLLSLQDFAAKTNLDSFYTTFRAAGRYTWVAYYSLLIWSFCTVAKFKMNRKAFAAIVLVCLLETHIFSLAKAKASLAARYQAGVEWQQQTKISKTQRELAALLATTDLFYDATGTWLASKEMPYLFPQAVNPAINTNYSPALTRYPKEFFKIYSEDKCLLAANALKLASEQGLQKTLLLMNNQTASSCKQLEFKPVMSLDANISIFSATQRTLD